MGLLWNCFWSFEMLRRSLFHECSLDFQVRLFFLHTLWKCIMILYRDRSILYWLVYRLSISWMIDFNFQSSEVLMIPISLHPVAKSLLFKGGFCLARFQGRGTSEGRTSTYGDTGRWKRREKKRGGRLQATNLKGVLLVVVVVVVDALWCRMMFLL